jgi:hypothetical protein
MLRKRRNFAGLLPAIAKAAVMAKIGHGIHWHKCSSEAGESVTRSDICRPMNPPGRTEIFDSQPLADRASDKRSGKQIRGFWRSRVVRHRSFRSISARRYLRRQDPERYQARGPADRAADQVRAGHQPQNGKNSRADGATFHPGTRRRDRMRRRELIRLLAGAVFGSPLLARAGVAAGRLPRSENARQGPIGGRGFPPRSPRRRLRRP